MDVIKGVLNDESNGLILASYPTDVGRYPIPAVPGTAPPISTVPRNSIVEVVDPNSRITVGSSPSVQDLPEDKEPTGDRSEARGKRLP